MNMKNPLFAVCMLALLVAPNVAAETGHDCFLAVTGVPQTPLSSGGRTASQLLTLNCPDSTSRVGDPVVTYTVTSSGQGGTGAGALDEGPPTVDYLGRIEDPSTHDLPPEVQALIRGVDVTPPGDTLLPGLSGIDPRDVGVDVVGENRWQDQWLVMVPNLSTYRVTFCVSLDVDGDGITDCDLCVSWGQWH